MAIVRASGRNHYNRLFNESIKEVPASMSMMIDSMVNMVQTSRKAELDSSKRDLSHDN
ncbi:hypothetical protein [Synechococcus sp. CC9616]|jgi:hypothetical protein|uniref:hypothetical protein n=1 Tax=Synechococcus sp. CC9616 TaxID=110663 RepID=UPI0012EBC3E5|nr:hypothetical protein [Synechococcus sp. CC9616]|tara:strand:- start:4187 stop:4360 length:174 start_codon:yes stop_codon:yes gene_type:complete